MTSVLKTISTIGGLLLLIMSTVDAHGYLTDPPSRNSLAREAGWNYCPHCLNAGTVGTVRANSPGRVWHYPETVSSSVRHGLCGDAAGQPQKHMVGGEWTTGEITRVYKENDVIDVNFSITAHHRGHVEFFLCDTATLSDPNGRITQDCLNQHPLRRVEDDSSSVYVPIDPAYPGRYFLPPKCAGSTGTADQFYPNAYAYKTKLQLPANLKCEHCVLQWYYVTGNTCNAPGYREFNGWPTEYSDCDGDGWGSGWYGTQVSYCLDNGAYPEEFWNCADIKIVSSDIQLTQPPSSSPTKPPSNPTETTFTPSPTPTDLGACAGPWQTCGGQSHNGPTCCENGLSCQRQSKWYSQCRSDCPSSWECSSAPSKPSTLSTLSPTLSIPVTSTPTVSPTNATSSTCANKWGACGGRNHQGPTCCKDGSQCFRKDQWYSQCRASCPTGWECQSHPITASPTSRPSPSMQPTNESTIDAPTNISGKNSTFVEEHGKLKLMGVQLVDENDQIVQLMGISSHGLHWFPQCYTKESIQYLVDNWNINVFRAAMYVNEGGYLNQKEVLKQRVSQIVNWCEEIGIYVLIDWHILTPGNPQVSQEESILFWQEMAAKFAGKKHVLYEIANEPNNCDWNENIKPYHDAIISSIRAIDAETIIIAGTPNWSQFLWDAESNPVDFPYNVMYSFHFYSGTHFNWDQIATYLTKIPVFVTEWGTSQASGGNGIYLGNSKTWLDTFSGERVDTGVVVSWLNWSYADKAESSAILQPGACSKENWGDVSDSGAFVRDYILSHATW